MLWRDESLKGLLDGEGPLPFDFAYGGQPCADYIRTCVRSSKQETFAGGICHTVTYVGDGLTVVATIKLFDAFPAMDLCLRFVNNRNSDTGIIERVHAAQLHFNDMMQDNQFVLHSANGAPSSPEDFLMHTKTLRPHAGATLGGRAGRSSNADLPFFRIDTARGAAVFGVGWSGQWQCTMRNTAKGLRVVYGLSETHFRLHGGESVDMPSLCVLFWEGEREECHSAFRRLVYEQYAPRLEGRNGDPYLFCNTCFTRFGGWLNECNEENQISLIQALQPLGTESVIVDAGWFVGGWPAGAGNWDADPVKYPHGMGIVAQAAHDKGMKYGLWFELERVVKGTELEREHPGWLLYNHASVDDGWTSDNMLLNMGIPEARAYALSVVQKYLEIPHFTVYRQDFNVDPLDYWRTADAPDRIGMTELNYLSGLYEFLDAIRLNHPDCFMDGCSSGGRRIDMRMIRHFHTHQKTDYWFNNRVDQNSLFALSHYLPASCVTAHINRYDDYTMDSVLPSTLCLGWIADAEEFPQAMAAKLIQRYNQVRPLLNDRFFALTPFSERSDGVLASQYHDREKNAGVVLLYMREDFSQWDSLPAIKLHGLDADSVYWVSCLSDGSRAQHTGASLMQGLEYALPCSHGYSCVYLYEKA